MMKRSQSAAGSSVALTLLSLVKYRVPDSRKVTIFLARPSDSLVKHSYTL